MKGRIIYFKYLQKPLFHQALTVHVFEILKEMLDFNMVGISQFLTIIKDSLKW